MIVSILDFFNLKYQQHAKCISATDPLQTIVCADTLRWTSASETGLASIPKDDTSVKIIFHAAGLLIGREPQSTTRSPLLPDAGGRLLFVKKQHRGPGEATRQFSNYLSVGGILIS